MFSVIIPTMWIGKEIETMMPLMVNHSLISEILIFDNDPLNRPNWFKENPKIRILSNGRNNFVNPCWNEGVRLAKNNLCCLYSDDVLFDIKIFDWISDRITDDMGYIGPDIDKVSIIETKNLISLDQLSITESVEIIIPRKDNSQEMIDINLGWAMLLFLQKKFYIPIPIDFKIYYGDWWFWAVNKKMGKYPRVLKNFKIASKVSSTVMSSPNIWNHHFHDHEQQSIKSVDERVREILP